MSNSSFAILQSFVPPRTLYLTTAHAMLPMPSSSILAYIFAIGWEYLVPGEATHIDGVHGARSIPMRTPGGRRHVFIEARLSRTPHTLTHSSHSIPSSPRECKTGERYKPPAIYWEDCRYGGIEMVSRRCSHVFFTQLSTINT